MIRLVNRFGGSELRVASDEQASYWEALGYRRVVDEAASAPVKKPVKKQAKKG